MHVSGSRIDLARVKPPPYQRAPSHSCRHPASARASPRSRPSRSSSSGVYVVDVHFGLCTAPRWPPWHARPPPDPRVGRADLSSPATAPTDHQPTTTRWSGPRQSRCRHREAAASRRPAVGAEHGSTSQHPARGEPRRGERSALHGVSDRPRCGRRTIVGGEVRGRHVQRHWRHGLDAQNFASRRAGEFHPAHLATQPERVTATDPEPILDHGAGLTLREQTLRQRSTGPPLTACDRRVGRSALLHVDHRGARDIEVLCELRLCETPLSTHPRECFTEVPTALDRPTRTPPVDNSRHQGETHRCRQTPHGRPRGVRRRSRCAAPFRHGDRTAPAHPSR